MCKPFQAVALAAPPSGLLPLERTEGSTPFEIVGVDFAGPIKYRKSSRVEGKGYLVLYTYSLTRAVYSDVRPTGSGKYNISCKLEAWPDVDDL